VPRAQTVFRLKTLVFSGLPDGHLPFQLCTVPVPTPTNLAVLPMPVPFSSSILAWVSFSGSLPGRPSRRAHPADLLHYYARARASLLNPGLRLPLTEIQPTVVTIHLWPPSHLATSELSRPRSSPRAGPH
jgi:hypothetical protein